MYKRSAQLTREYIQAPAYNILVLIQKRCVQPALKLNNGKGNYTNQTSGS